MREMVVTKDGSHTIAIPEKRVMYHSVHGAIQESRHVYLEAGLHHVFASRKTTEIAVFEMGFGTGLNALLTAIEATEHKQKIFYTTVETAPLLPEEAMRLNYASFCSHAPLFRQIHQCPWNEVVALHAFFSLHKMQTNFTTFSSSQRFDLIYYDAFAPSAQPELWTKPAFEKLYALLYDKGVLVTYCAKGDVRRAMTTAGFFVERLPGPIGKREMLRALKGPVLA